MKTKNYFLLLVLLSFQMVAQEISLVKDINQGESNSYPERFKIFDGKLIFKSQSNLSNQRIFISDGTTNGTIPLKDGLRDGNPDRGVVLGGKLYFNANFSGSGDELWVTNGTADGTTLIKDVNPSNRNAFYRNSEIIEYNGKIYFTADDGTHGKELWVTNGEESQTILLKDINPNGGNADIKDLTVSNGLLFFTATDGNLGRELWVTNGEEANTRMVMDIYPGVVSSLVSELTDFNDKLYFSARGDDTGNKLWVTDGTNTNLVENYNGTAPRDFKIFNDDLLFSTFYNGIYKIKGDDASVEFIGPINTSTNNETHLQEGVILNNKLYFVAKGGSTSTSKGKELWFTDGETNTRVKDIYEGTNNGVSDNQLVLYKNNIYFQGNHPDTGKELWKSNGEIDNATLVQDFNTDQNFEPKYFTVVNEKLIFSARGQQTGLELFSYTTNNVDPVGKTRIPDIEFERHLRSINLDDVEDGYVLTANINSITELFMDGKSITDLSGIEAFTALKTLSVANNNLSEININQNTNLEVLICNQNNLTSLNTTGLSKLKRLSIGENSFETIDFSHNENLETLDCDRNGATSLNINGNTKMTELLAFDNQLTAIDFSENFDIEIIDISENQLSNIDVSLNTKLISLWVNNNTISALNLNANSALEEVNCTNNRLTNLDLSSNTSLTKLFCLNNRLSNLNIKNGNNTNFSITNGVRDLKTQNNPNLACIQVDDVAFATANFTEIDAISTFNEDCTTVQAGKTYVPDNAFEQALIDLNLDDTLDNFVATTNIEGLTSLDVNGKGISDATGIEAFVALTSLNISSNNLTSLNTSNNSNLTLLNCSSNILTYLYILDNSALLELNANNNQLSTVYTNGNFSLEKLEINNNKLVELPLAGNYALTYLDCSHNKLIQLELFSAFNLTDVICNNNKINELDLGLESLKNIILNDNNLFALRVTPPTMNNIEAFNTQNNENLYCIEVSDVAYADTNFTNIDAQVSFNVDCEFSKLTDVPDDNFEQRLIDLGLDDFMDNLVRTVFIKNLKTLELQTVNSNFAIDDLTGIEDFVSLETLNLMGNSLNALNLTNNINLKNINISGNQLNSTIDISKNILLEEFYAGTNNFTSLDLTKNINLKKLSLSYNELTNIDISKNTLLTELNIVNNDLTTIDLSQNTVLEILNLQGNQLNTIDVSLNTNLIRFSIPNNNISTIDVSNNLTLERLGVSNNNLSSLDVTANQQLLFLYTQGNNLSCVSVFDTTRANEQWKFYADENTIFTTDCNDLVYIPDNNFEQYFIDRNLDDTLDNYVSKSNIENIEGLQILSKEIVDLTGIEAFTNLTTIDFSFNQVKTVDFSNNLLLEEITCQFNDLNTITLPASTTLKKLDIHTNKISSLDLSSYVNLEFFQATKNQFTAFDFSNNINLERLHIVLNKISSGSIDVSNNTKLKALGVSSTGLNTIDISNNTDLEILYCDRNNLTSLNTSKNTKLKTLECGRGPLALLDLSKNILLENLDCRISDLTRLDLTNTIRLTNLNAKSNKDLTCIKVWDIAFANANWSDDIDTTASFGTNCYTAIPDSIFEQALIDKGYDSVIDGYVTTANIATVTSLNLQSEGINDLTGIEAFTALTNLNLKGNSLTSLDISENRQLTNLNVSDNNLDRLNISNNTNLTLLEANDNTNLTCVQVWDVGFAANSWADKIPASATFNINCDNVWTIEVDNKTETVLSNITGLDKNNDGNITIAEAKEFIGELDLSGKNLDNIDGLQAFIGVKKLDLSGNNLKDLSALTGRKITLVNKSTGQKKQVDTQELSLETLILSNNSLETLNLEALTNLRVIDISNNPSLATVSVKNGNNANITSFDATNSPNLTCIIVDDTSATYLTNFNKDEKSNFVADLIECRSVVLSTEEFLQKDVNVFPNPVTRFLTIESTKEFDYIEVYNTIGKKNIKTNERKINFSNFPSGIYVIKIIAENKVLTKKIIKN